MSRRRIAVVTTARADYSYYRPVLSRIVAAPDLDLRLFVTGMHLSPAYGLTVRAIESDGFAIAERIDMSIAADTPLGVASSMGAGVTGMAAAIAKQHPDIMLLLGDRFEMLAAAVAAQPFALPLAHIAGGELTEGANDDAARHAITKLSHLHFVQAAAYRARVIQMGEEPWRVIVAGAASLDNLETTPLLEPAQFERRYGCSLSPPPLVVTFHPVTLEPGESQRHAEELVAALEAAGLPVIFTAVNADVGNQAVARVIDRYVACHANARAVASFGTQGYFSLLAHASAVVGNSSSGIVEAATFELPVVNIGTRQAGRVRARNVIDVPCERAVIAEAIARAVSPAFRSSLQGLANPYGDGHASQEIVHVLRTIPLGRSLIVKRFYDLTPYES